MTSDDPLLGQNLPAFDLPTDGDRRATDADFKGQTLVLYLYPKDDTSGCTKESQDFSDRYRDFKAAGAEVVGLSKDGVKSHDKFKAKYGFPFPLLSDEDTTLISALGSWVEKSMYGRKYMGADRSTFLIDRDGVIQKVWRKVKVPGHVDDVLAAVKAMG
ncbi:MAG: peroxiredoxin [Alphaproteobacteria bacterium]|nr:peroxiredoxin [Alphaproteobacteria bacterium]